MKSDDLQVQLEQYKRLRTETERRSFLQAQRDRIAKLSPKEAKAEVKAIADKVDEIARKVEAISKPNAA
jgi:hypothetical protein